MSKTAIGHKVNCRRTLRRNAVTIKVELGQHGFCPHLDTMLPYGGPCMLESRQHGFEASLNITGPSVS